MDYDATNLPAVYDRARDLGSEVFAMWMRAIESHLAGQPVTDIVDLGCGTGRFTERLAAWFNASVIGIDPSTKMLARARAKRRATRVSYLPGRAESIPLGTGSADMIFMSMSFHHFSDRPAAARECRRVLRNQGTVVVRTGTREQVASYPYVPFFPSSLTMLNDTLPDYAEVRSTFEAARFRLVASEIIGQATAPSWQAYVDKVAALGDSVLARLSPRELEAGLASLRAHAAASEATPVVEPIDLFFFRERRVATPA